MVPYYSTSGESKNFALHSQMYALADKYQVADLREVAQEKFKDGRVRFWNSADFVHAARHAFSVHPTRTEA